MKKVEQDKAQKFEASEQEALFNTFKISRRVAEDIAGCMDETGRQELEAWLQESDEHKTIFQDIKDELITRPRTWPYSGEQVECQLMMFHQRRAKVSRRSVGWWRYVAVFILLLGIAGVIHWRVAKQDVMNTPIQMAQGYAVLVLSNGEKVTLQDSLGSVSEEPSVDIQVSDQMISYKNERERVREQTYNRLVVPRGGEFKVELADGTRVWLNAQSELRYPVQFIGNQRVVYLKGEGYFEVTSNEEKPFIVRTLSDVEVKVLGTRFNVSAYEDDADVTTTLAEGSVEVTVGGESIRIVPNEQLVFDKKRHTSLLREVNASVYSAWKDGNFCFENQRLEQIMEQLKRWYEIEVFYAREEVKNCRFTGDLKKYDNFEKIVKMIEEVAGVKININGYSIIIGAK